MSVQFRKIGRGKSAWLSELWIRKSNLLPHFWTQKTQKKGLKTDLKKGRKNFFYFCFSSFTTLLQWNLRMIDEYCHLTDARWCYLLWIKEVYFLKKVIPFQAGMRTKKAKSTFYSKRFSILEVILLLRPLNHKLLMNPKMKRLKYIMCY